ncbi:HEAT repeat domain-containing protein [Actinoplanes sp. RD1]|uniref:HEAT repeat domain-containing protein n=1 Tax=Actinoplanes sp. RD1 TaxID=3064538 RepID=UPI00274298A6|nr:HEAT repeat domain-containing protein [Actinoplanes sp. RD1]
MFDSLTSAYGPATEVPGLLTALRSDDPGRRGFARSELEHMLAQHGAKFEASVAAVPFLVDILGGEGHGRHEAYELLALISDNDQPPRHRTRRSGPALGELTRSRFEWRLSRAPDDPADRYPWHFDPPSSGAHGWERRAYEAVGAGLSAYVRLLHDPDPRLRIGAAHLVAAHPSPAAVPALTAQLAAETSPMAAASLCVAAGQCGETGDAALLDVLGRWRETAHPLAHLSALTGIAQLTDSPDVHLLTELAERVVEPDDPADDWPFFGEPARGAYWALETLCPADNPLLAEILLEQLRNHRPERVYYSMVELLLGTLFPGGPLPDTASFGELGEQQQEFIRLALRFRLLDEDPMPSAFAGCNLPTEAVSLEFWAAF